MSGPEVGTRLLLANGPWDREAALALLAAHTIPGAETTTGTVHRRLLRLDGRLVPVAVDLGQTPTLTAPAEQLDAAEAVVRRWFELDAEQEARNRFLGSDPLLAPLVSARPGLRVTGHPDPLEALLGIVIGQQISLAAARTVTGRLVAAFGTPGPDGLLAFPTADDLAGLDVDELRSACGFMASRAQTLLTVTRAIADGLDLHTPDRAALRRELLALRGIGPWTVDFLLLRIGEADVFPSGDLVLRKVLGVTTDRAARERALAWSPHRSLAALHLWTTGAYLA